MNALEDAFSYAGDSVRQKKKLRGVHEDFFKISHFNFIDKFL